MTLSISLRESQENFLFLNHLKSCENHYTYTDTLLLSVAYHRPKIQPKQKAIKIDGIFIIFCEVYIKEAWLKDANQLWPILKNAASVIHWIYLNWGFSEMIIYSVQAAG